MFMRKRSPVRSDALDVASRNEKAESLLTRREVKIVNKSGLCSRPAAEFVRAVSVFRSEIWIIKGEQRFSARSVIDVLTANLNCGDSAIIEGDGPDSLQAITGLAKLVAEFRHEESKNGWARCLCLEEDY
jgi:phosphotransferase system HPr (HPr) family protein